MKLLCCMLMACLLKFSTASVYAQCGNLSSYGPSSPPLPIPPPGGDPFDAFTGNEHRVVNDLEIWGGVGEIPLMWKRYYNSREFTGFTHSFHYLMADAGNDNQGNPRVNIAFPNGSQVIFTQSAANPALWLPVSGVAERLLQNGTNFFLQYANGHRYRFKKFINPEGSFYQLQDFNDNYQNLYILTYNSKGALSRIIEPAGRYFEISYDNINGQDIISKVSTSDGRSIQYNYTIHTDNGFSWALLTSVDYGDGTHATYTYHPPHYSGFGYLYLAHAVDPRYEGAQANMRFTYDNNIARGYIKEEINGKTGHIMSSLTTASDSRWVCYATGQVQHYVMPKALLGKTIKYTDGLGRATQYTYDANGFIETQTDPSARITTYTRTVFGNPLEIIHPDGSKEKWTRDELDQILTYTDELDRVTTYIRDASHRVTKVVYPDGTSEQFIYNNFGQVLKHTHRNGAIEMTTYNNRGLKITLTDALGNVTSYTYDGADRLGSVTDARGNITRHEYNERGLLTKTINPDNSFLSYTYDAFGNRTSSTNEIGNTWKTVFDEFKRPVNEIDPLNRTKTYNYDLPGGVCGCVHAKNSPGLIRSPGGNTIQMEYDTEWQKIKHTADAGSTNESNTFYEYDAAGNLITMIDPLLKTTLYEYDKRDRLISTKNPLGNTTRYTHDKVGNVLTVMRPDSNITISAYDNMDRLNQITDSKGQITKMSYDNQNNLIQVTDANNNHYNFEYDLLNRRVKMIYPDGSFERYVYDPVGNLIFYTNRSAEIRSFTYDTRNRETNSSWSDNTSDVIRSYDAASRLLSLSNNASLITYTYDNVNNIISETQFVQGSMVTKQVSYVYNADDLKTSIIYPHASRTVTYDYTKKNQVSSITVNGDNFVVYGYDRKGNRIAQFMKNAVGTSRIYDDNNRVLSITHQKGGTAFAHFDYGYDKVDRRIFVRRNYAKGDVYNYDAIDQLINVQYEVSNPHAFSSNAARTVDYNYDAMGNRTVVNDNGAITNYTSNILNQYTQINADVLTYNANGDLKTFNGWIYQYDAEGRLTQATKAGTTIDFAYDAKNRCVKRSVNGVPVFLYYNEWNLIEEANVAGAVLTQYIHGTETDEIISKITTENVFFHYDALGNVTQLTNGNGIVIEKYFYDVFGTPSISDGNGNLIGVSAWNNRFLFTGREFISELESYDYRNRKYSPVLGRFMRPDPIGFEGKDYNLYRYVKNNPVNLTDPDGLFFLPWGWWKMGGGLTWNDYWQSGLNWYFGWQPSWGLAETAAFAKFSKWYYWYWAEYFRRSREKENEINRLLRKLPN